MQPNNMTITHLARLSFDEILDCFQAAFENYHVPIPTEKAYYQQRWKAAKVDFSRSYGMLDHGKLVGFIIHAVDRRQGFMTAYNTGTGVLPAYRGKRIVRALYGHAVEDLRQHGIERSTLEVITANDRAVRAYQSVGFEVCKTYMCFQGTIRIENQTTFKLEQVDLGEVRWDQLPRQEYCSWDHQPASLRAGQYHYYQVTRDDSPESYCIIQPDRGYVAQMDVLRESSGAWDRLLAAIQTISPTVKINNVDARLEDKIHHLKAAALTHTINQYEMELDLGG